MQTLSRWLLECVLPCNHVILRRRGTVCVCAHMTLCVCGAGMYVHEYVGGEGPSSSETPIWSPLHTFTHSTQEDESGVTLYDLIRAKCTATQTHIQYSHMAACIQRSALA